MSEEALHELAMAVWGAPRTKHYRSCLAAFRSIKFTLQDAELKDWHARTVILMMQLAQSLVADTKVKFYVEEDDK